MELRGAVAIVTGANHGIGAATARALTDAGAKVLLSYLRLPAPAASGETPIKTIRAQANGHDVAASIRASGGQARALEGDITDTVTITALFDAAERHLGPVDIVINNAAHAEPDTFRLTAPTPGVEANPLTTDSFLAHARLNCAAPAAMISELVGRRAGDADQEASVVNVSTDGSPGFVGEVSYGASKHALASLSRAAALELGPLGIRVNVVAPGPIQTGYIPPAEEARIAAATPLGRVGRPEDVADVITFLCTDQARWLTGQVLFVGGGWRVW